MTLENQVVSLELSKRLKELGVEQESLCYWVEPVHTRKPETKPFVQVEWPAGYTARPHIASALTVAELGAMLTHGYVTGRTAWEEEEKWWACHWYKVDDRGIAIDSAFEETCPYNQPIFANTEANARAKMVCYLIENGLLKL